jgi:hypothetical protein
VLIATEKRQLVPGDQGRGAAPLIQAIFFSPFLGRSRREQKFPAFPVRMENSFPNPAVPGLSCIVLDSGDLLERRHERDCPEARLEPGAKSSMI